jgi:membrane protease YdiL (CAAX protease family)
VRLRGWSQPAVLSREVVLVLGVSLGISAIYSVLSLIAKLTAARSLNQQTTALNTSPAPGRPVLALMLELVGILADIMPALLAIHLLNRDQPPPRLGLDTSRWRFDLVSGVALAGLVGIPGLALYIAARELGVNTIVAAANLTEWWAPPVLVLAAAGNGVLEEIVMVGYLLTRLRSVGWGMAAAVAFSSVLRGTYHLYQGFGAFAGNAIMGVVFCYFFLRTGRLWPLILAHTLLDVVAYLGYTVLHDKIAWLIG